MTRWPLLDAGHVGIRISPAGTFNDINDPDAAVTYPLLAALNSPSATRLGCTW